MRGMCLPDFSFLLTLRALIVIGKVGSVIATCSVKAIDSSLTYEL